MLVDRQIREALATGELIVRPDDGIRSRIQPASLDVRLGTSFVIFDKARIGVVDPRKNQTEAMVAKTAEDDGSFLVLPDELVLATTLEEIGLAPTLAARIEGKSSLGRLGLLVHSTAGFIDPGWPTASITLEIASVSGLPVRLYPGMPIAQLAFERVEVPDCIYRGKYIGQSGATPSRYHENFQNESR
jgi:dCTP deaminase